MPPPIELDRGPSTPHAPVTASRPESWPGGASALAPTPAHQASLGRHRDSRMPANVVPCEGAEIIARIGNDVILASELSLGFAEIRAQYKDQMPPEALEAQLRGIMRQRLEPRLETKLIYQHAVRTIPADNLPKFKDRVGEEFERRELPNMMKRAQVGSRRELEEKLQAMGVSLESQKRAFIEQILAHEWLRQQVKPEDEASFDEMLAYYHDHQDDFKIKARARWEQLSLRIGDFPSNAEAYAALAELGNQVMGGAPLADVAKAKSHGPTAEQGGLRDWTNKGSLVCADLERALFGLPVGQLSPILEDDRYLHIVRVVEREDAHMVSFLEAQVKIREKIRQQRITREREKYLAKLRQEIPVWTVFDNDPAPNRAAAASSMVQ